MPSLRIGQPVWHLITGIRWTYIGIAGIGLLRVYHPEHGRRAIGEKYFSRGPATLSLRERTIRAKKRDWEKRRASRAD